MTLADELLRLEDLRRSGAITESEYTEAKRRLFEVDALNRESDQQGETDPLEASSSQPSSAGSTRPSPGQNPYSSHSRSASGDGLICGMEERMWCALMHLSQLLVYSLLGIVVPVAMWLASKDESEYASRQGARMINWMISGLIYKAFAGVLCIFLVGIPLLMLLALLDIIFPIIAAIKANQGELWSYPLAIRFFPED